MNTNTNTNTIMVGDVVAYVGSIRPVHGLYECVAVPMSARDGYALRPIGATVRGTGGRSLTGVRRLSIRTLA